MIQRREFSGALRKKATRGKGIKLGPFAVAQFQKAATRPVLNGPLDHKRVAPGCSPQPSLIFIFGLEDQADRFVIAVDISQSVVNNMQKRGIDIH